MVDHDKEVGREKASRRGLFSLVLAQLFSDRTAFQGSSPSKRLIRSTPSRNDSLHGRRCGSAYRRYRQPCPPRNVRCLCRPTAGKCGTYQHAAVGRCGAGRSHSPIHGLQTGCGCDQVRHGSSRQPDTYRSLYDWWETARLRAS